MSAPAPEATEKVATRQDKAKTWTRNDTARWLNERSSGVVAWLRRTNPSRAPKHSSAMGRWLLEQDPVLFRLVHSQLAAAAETEREKLTLIGVLS